MSDETDWENEETVRRCASPGCDEFITTHFLDYCSECMTEYINEEVD